MDRKFLRQNDLSRINQFTYAFVQVDLSALTASQSATGVTVGSEIVTGAISSNTVTLNFTAPVETAPYIFYQPLTANAAVNPSTTDTTQVVFSQVTRDDNTTGIATGKVNLWIVIPYGLDLI
jgi:hypothetical protein